jgi:hypothetical protein
MIMEGVQHHEFKNMILSIAEEFESRLSDMEAANGHHLRAIAEGNKPEKMTNPVGIFSMACIACHFEIPRLYSVDYIPETIKTFRGLNRVQNRVTDIENGTREAPKANGIYCLNKWISRTAYDGLPTEILDPEARSLLIQSLDVRDGHVHYHVVVDNDRLVEKGLVTALSFCRGFQYEDATIHLCGQVTHCRLPTALRRCCACMQDICSSKPVWSDVFNDPCMEQKLGKDNCYGTIAKNRLHRSIYSTNATFKAGWHGREVIYFARGFILQEFMCGLPIETASIHYEWMGPLGRYERAVHQMAPGDRLIWITCWSALLCFMGGLKNPNTATRAFNILLSADASVYGRTVLARIDGMWREGAGSGGLGGIGDAMSWVAQALGPEGFERAAPTAERMLREATLVLAASMRRQPSYGPSAIDGGTGLQWTDCSPSS